MNEPSVERSEFPFDRPNEIGRRGCRRQHPRYNVVRSVLAIPVLPDGRLNWEGRADGISYDVSAGGLGLEVRAQPAQLGKCLLVGVEDEFERFSFVGVDVRFTAPGKAGGVRIGGTFGGLANHILRPESLTPTLEQDTFTYNHPVSAQVLENWEKAGVLTPVVCDRVQLCPKCQGLPTFRRACRSCRSARTVQHRLIHHYACAHVGFVSDFECDGHIACPKCRTHRLVTGADFEYLNGQHRCVDCNWEDDSLELIGHCLRCGYRFPGEEAVEQDLHKYHAHILDWRRMIESTYPSSRTAVETYPATEFVTGK